MYNTDFCYRRDTFCNCNINYNTNSNYYDKYLVRREWCKRNADKLKEYNKKSKTKLISQIIINIKVFSQIEVSSKKHINQSKCLSKLSINVRFLLITIKSNR